MCLFNTKARWGFVTKFFHWGILLLILAAYLLAEGEFPFDLNMSGKEIMALHFSIGISVLCLGVLRIVWRLVNKTPELPKNTTKPAKIAMGVTYGFMYLLTILIPITGYIMVGAEGHTISMFNSFDIPNLIANNRAAAKVFEDVHETMFNVLLFFVLIHTAAALLHGFVLRDGILRRMMPFAGCCGKCTKNS